MGKYVDPQIALTGIDHAGYALEAIVDEDLQHGSVQKDMELHNTIVSKAEIRYLGLSYAQVAVGTTNYQSFFIIIFYLLPCPVHSGFRRKA